VWEDICIRIESGEHINCLHLHMYRKKNEGGLSLLLSLKYNATTNISVCMYVCTYVCMYTVPKELKKECLYACILLLIHFHLCIYTCVFITGLRQIGIHLMNNLKEHVIFLK
jgi:hypothetical protein